MRLPCFASENYAYGASRLVLQSSGTRESLGKSLDEGTVVPKSLHFSTALAPK